MLHAHNQDRLYLIAPSDEQEALIDALAFNVQDRHWLVYCALGGHAHTICRKWICRPVSVFWTSIRRLDPPALRIPSDPAE
ncbi:hypothetical protein FX982_00770 [Pseudomonas graminis]|uniref:Uncharacterized protein n=1 Tax=Pseudomonas graminis TaxID=158627 RepID=A0A6M8MFD5_9PSED|nr:hypothetical protein FX982_00770 [Pseudomonas graminis]